MPVGPGEDRCGDRRRGLQGRSAAWAPSFEQNQFAKQRLRDLALHDRAPIDDPMRAPAPVCRTISGFCPRNTSVTGKRRWRRVQCDTGKQFAFRLLAADSTSYALDRRAMDVPWVSSRPRLYGRPSCGGSRAPRNWRRSVSKVCVSTRRTRGSFFDGLTAARNVSCTTVPPSRRQEPCPGGAETRKGAGSIVASKSPSDCRRCRF